MRERARPTRARGVTMGNESDHDRNSQQRHCRRV